MTGVPAALAHLDADVISREVVVPTRHADVRCILYQPSPRPVEPAPLYVHFHGGAFIVRHPEQDDHLCRHVVARTGAMVLSVDYDTAPQSRYPTAEAQAYAVLAWASQSATEMGWDASRIAVGGTSAGAKLAVNACQQAHQAATPMPIALVFAYGVTDMTLPPRARTSPKRFPAVAPWLIRLMYQTYFPDASLRRKPLASPGLDPDLGYLPPTLILTGELDAMADEERRFAEMLTKADVPVTYREFTGVDHGFTHDDPIDTAMSALDAIATHLSGTFDCHCERMRDLPR